MSINTTLPKRTDSSGRWFRVCKFEGVWHEWKKEDPIAILVSAENTGQIKVRPINNPQYKNAIGMGAMAYSRTLQNSDEKALRVTESLTSKAFANHIIVDWKDFSANSDNGEEIELPFSVDAALHLIREDPTFQECVRGLASNLNNFDAETPEELGKNLQE